MILRGTIRITITLLIIITWCVTLSSAQKVDNTAFYRKVPAGKSLRLHYENDFFSRSDIYYTQGINLEYYNPGLGKIFKGPLLRLRNGKTNYGIALEHLGFTPTSISSSTILYGDRPFSACLMAKAFSVSNDASRKIQLSSTLSMGIVGPGAGGKQFQSAIHRWINDRQPKGWENQISNDMILNYNASIVKSVLDLRWLTLGAKVGGDLGSLNTRINGGLVLLVGVLENRWDTNAGKTFQVYLYDEPLGSLIGYDATLQGGIFNNRSPYTIAGNDVTRTVFQNNSGIVFVIRKLQLEYFQSFNTKEFTYGHAHHWGGIRMGVML